MQRPPLIACLVLLYTAWSAQDLIPTWRHAPLERYSWLVLVVWSTPILGYWYFKPKLISGQMPCHPILLGVALLVSLVGTLGSINAVRYYGFAIALSAFIPWSWRHIPWLITASAWMPLLGWLGSHHTPSNLLYLRFSLATAAAIWLMLGLYFHKAKN